MKRKIILSAAVALSLGLVSLVNAQEIKKSAAEAGKSAVKVETKLMKATAASAKTPEEARAAKLAALAQNKGQNASTVQAAEFKAKKKELIARINKLPATERKKALRAAWKDTFKKEREKVK